MLYLISLSIAACQFYPLGENRRFERVSENIGVGKYSWRWYKKIGTMPNIIKKIELHLHVKVIP